MHDHLTSHGREVKYEVSFISFILLMRVMEVFDSNDDQDYKFHKNRHGSSNEDKCSNKANEIRIH
jgi:hypothetical protein